MRRLAKRLLEKSKHTFILSLETYNRLTTEYRVEAFTILYVNAWELLLKAKIIKDTNKTNSIFYKKQKNQQKKSISLSDCLNKIFNENDPIRKNIEEIQSVRDSSTHLVVDELDKIYVGLFQAGVLNYIDCLNSWFSIELNKEINPAMLSIMFDFNPINFIKIKSKYGSEVAEFIKGKQEKIEKESEQLKDRRYKVEVEYKVALVKNPKKADIVLAQGEIGPETKGILIEVPKDPTLTHPYRGKEVVEEVNKALSDTKITSYDIQSIVFVENIKDKVEYHYHVPKITARLYSKKFVEMIIGNVKKDKSYLEKVRKAYKSHMDSIRIKNKTAKSN